VAKSCVTKSAESNRAFHFPPLVSIVSSANNMSELQTAKDQLALVNLSLEADSGNDELLKLKTELLELIDLIEPAATKKEEKAAKADARVDSKGKGRDTNWQEHGKYTAGMDCMAKYKDGKL